MHETTAIPRRGAGDSQSTLWNERTPAEIIDHILQRFHEPLRRELPALVAAARRVEAEEQGHPQCPTGLAAHLEQVLLAVESHLQKEEKILFPLILAGRGGVAFMPIKVMMAEHDDHKANLERLAVLAHAFAAPPDADSAWCELYRRLADLDRELREHIALEDHVLFTRVLGGGATV